MARLSAMALIRMLISIASGQVMVPGVLDVALFMPPAFSPSGRRRFRPFLPAQHLRR